MPSLTYYRIRSGDLVGELGALWVFFGESGVPGEKEDEWLVLPLSGGFLNQVPRPRPAGGAGRALPRDSSELWREGVRDSTELWRDRRRHSTEVCRATARPRVSSVRGTADGRGLRNKTINES
jgi:hypothetical protein